MNNPQIAEVELQDAQLLRITGVTDNTDLTNQMFIQSIRSIDSLKKKKCTEADSSVNSSKKKKKKVITEQINIFYLSS